IVGFQEKPKDPEPMPDNPDMCLVSMGNYIFSSDSLVSELKNDANADTAHDFGKNILPALVESKKLFAYNFYRNKILGDNTPGQNYWKDVGTLQAYYECNIDLRAANPQLDLYNKSWPIYSYHVPRPPAKFIHNEEVSPNGRARIGKAINSLVSNGCIISGSTVTDSILSSDVVIHSYSTISESVFLEDVEIKENCSIRNTIIDKHTVIPCNTMIGYDRKEDEKRYHVVDLPQGKWLTVLGKKGTPKELSSHITHIEMETELKSLTVKTVDR
ncbi:MAG: sugar phosphate nucleotidyltransferase, partial [Verrucomicrobiota bacterium]|nr:sugar phosphate nucleotidyltransferase [Verrucomicrobiota bacterium]